MKCLAILMAAGLVACGTSRPTSSESVVKDSTASGSSASTEAFFAALAALHVPYFQVYVLATAGSLSAQDRLALKSLGVEIYNTAGGSWYSASVRNGADVSALRRSGLISDWSLVTPAEKVEQHIANGYFSFFRDCVNGERT